MKFVAKCSAFVSFSYQVRVKVCNPIPLKSLGGQLVKTATNIKGS